MYGLFIFSPLSIIGISVSLYRWIKSLRLANVVGGLARGEYPLVVVAMGLVGVLALWNVTNGPSFVEDEGTYTAQAWSVLHGHLTPYFYTYDHPPLGWLQMAPFVG